MAAFPRAAQPDIVRAAQKDASYASVRRSMRTRASSSTRD
jgi:hypothetical protein